jgi:SAM-dependent methyltransferase
VPTVEIKVQRNTNSTVPNRCVASGLMFSTDLTFIRRIPMLRSGWYLVNALISLGKSWRRQSADAFDYDYQAKIDPWGYSTQWGSTHLNLAEKLLDKARNGGLFQRAFEIGWGEGFVTEVLAPRCISVLAVDIAKTALDRGRLRCANWKNVRFDQWDLLQDDAPPACDLVLLMGVLEYFRRPQDLFYARSKITKMLAPGDHLLITSTRRHEVIEGACWDRWLLRGSQHICDFLARHSLLRMEATASTPTQLFTLYRKKTQAD